MHRKHYSEEEKNAVMSRYAAGGEEVNSMLAEYGIPKSTFNQWLREYDRRFGCDSKYDFSPRNFRNILMRNDHLEDLISVMQRLHEKLQYKTPDQVEEEYYQTLNESM